MTRQEEVRERLNYMITMFGTNQAWLAKQLNVSVTVINKFKTGNREVSERVLNLLDNFLKERGL